MPGSWRGPGSPVRPVSAWAGGARSGVWVCVRTRWEGGYMGVRLLLEKFGGAVRTGPPQMSATTRAIWARWSSEIAGPPFGRSSFPTFHEVGITAEMTESVISGRPPHRVADILHKRPRASGSFTGVSRAPPIYIDIRSAAELRGPCVSLPRLYELSSASRGGVCIDSGRHAPVDRQKPRFQGARAAPETRSGRESLRR